MNFDHSLKQPKKLPRRIEISSPSNFQPQAYKTIRKIGETIYTTQPSVNTQHPTPPLSKLLDQHRAVQFENSKGKPPTNPQRQYQEYQAPNDQDHGYYGNRDVRYHGVTEDNNMLYRNQATYSNSIRTEDKGQVFNSFHIQKPNNSTRQVERSRMGEEHDQMYSEAQHTDSIEKNKMLSKLEFFKEKPQSTNVNTSRTENKVKNPVIDSNEKPDINLKKFSIDDFEIGIKLGKGKFGDVFLAREKKTDFIVALKVLNKAEIQRLNAEKLVVREIKIHSFLDHKNIIKLYGFFHDDENIYLILEYAPDGELYKELKATPNNRFTEEKTSKILRQVLDAFIYLQSLDIIHRDLKPENLLSFMGQVKLADFGWSVCAPDKKRKTFCGTIDYMPPEMAHGTQYDFKTDNWAIGVLAYEFLVGKAPFETKSRGLTLDGIKKGEIQYPSFLSEEAKDFINKLLLIDPQMRIELTQATQHPFIRKYNKE